MSAALTPCHQPPLLHDILISLWNTMSTPPLFCLKSMLSNRHRKSPNFMKPPFLDALTVPIMLTIWGWEYNELLIHPSMISKTLLRKPLMPPFSFPAIPHNPIYKHHYINISKYHIIFGRMCFSISLSQMYVYPKIIGSIIIFSWRGPENSRHLLIVVDMNSKE